MTHGINHRINHRMPHRMSAPELARSLIPYAAQICSDCLPGGRIVGHEYHTQNLQGGFHQVKPGQTGNSLRVNVHKGIWSDFASSEKGGDLLNLIAATRTGGVIGKAMVLARERYLGRVPHNPSPCIWDDEVAPVSRNEKREQTARWLWGRGKGITGTPAVRYLASRGLPAVFTEDVRGLRFLAKAKHCSATESLTALVAQLTNARGETIGIHRIFLTQDGEKYQGGEARLGLGTLRGSALRIGSGAVQFVTESIEDGLSVASVSTVPVMAAASANHLAALDVNADVHTILVGADNDAAGHGACERLADRYPACRVLPAFPPDRYKDWNDCLTRIGPAKMRRIIDSIFIQHRIRFT